MLAGAVAPQVLTPAADVPAPKAASDLGDDSDSIGVDSAGAKTDEASVSALATPDVSVAALGIAASGLNATLKTKLVRVIERMHTEFGRDVRVVEGVRSQQRQNQLYAQGRDTVGPVVTWTRNSQHTAGRAADLVINGGYDDATGFALLRQVAEQEGLHTLGAKDPGHVELRGAASPTDSASVRSALNALDLQPAADSVRSAAKPARQALRDNLIVATSSMGRIATPAAVASVATVARVATLARVAQVGSMTAAPATATTTVKAEAASAPIAAPAGKPSGGNTQTGGEQSSGAEQGSERQDGALRRTTRVGERVEHNTSAHGADSYRALDGSRDAGGLADNSVADALSDARGTTASHATRAMDAQDAPGPRTLKHITLSLDDGNGGQDQVRVGMRGTSVGASFDMSSVSSADRVSSRLGELTKALEQHGLEPQSFQVRASSTLRESDAARVTTSVPGAQRAVADTAATRNDSQSAFAGDGRQRFSHQSDQQEQAQRRQTEQRRRAHSFSLNSEES